MNKNALSPTHSDAMTTWTRTPIKNNSYYADFIFTILLIDIDRNEPFFKYTFSIANTKLIRYTKLQDKKYLKRE